MVYSAKFYKWGVKHQGDIVQITPFTILEKKNLNSMNDNEAYSLAFIADIT